MDNSDKYPRATGFFFDKPREGAPDFIKGRLSIRVDDALNTLKLFKNERGYVNLELCKSKDGTKPYLQVNTYGLEPKPRDEVDPPKDGDIPF